MLALGSVSIVRFGFRVIGFIEKSWVEVTFEKFRVRVGVPVQS